MPLEFIFPVLSLMTGTSTTGIIELGIAPCVNILVKHLHRAPSTALDEYFKCSAYMPSTQQDLLDRFFMADSTSFWGDENFLIQ